MKKLRVIRDFKTAGMRIMEGDLIIITNNEIMVMYTHDVMITPVCIIIDFKERNLSESELINWIKTIYDNTKADDLM